MAGIELVITVRGSEIIRKNAGFGPVLHQQLELDFGQRSRRVTSATAIEPGRFSLDKRNKTL